MAKPKLEDGYLKISNELCEAFQRLHLSGNQWRLLWAVLRQTYGWNKKMECISLTTFQQQTGTDRRNLKRVLDVLVSRNILLRDCGNYVVAYGLQKNYKKWILENGVKTYTSVDIYTKTSVENNTATSVKNSTPYIYKNNKDKRHIVDFEKIWLKYPVKDGKKAAQKSFSYTVKNEQDWQAINQALDNYLDHLKREAWKRPKSGSSWFNNWQDWTEWQEPETQRRDVVV